MLFWGCHNHIRQVQIRQIENQQSPVSPAAFYQNIAVCTLYIPEVFPSVLSVPLIHTRQWYRCTILLYAVTSMQIGQQVLPLQQ